MVAINFNSKFYKSKIRRIQNFIMHPKKHNQAVENGVLNGQTATTSRSIELQSSNPELQNETQLLQISNEEDDESSEKPPESEWVIAIKDKLYQARNEDSAVPWAKHSIYRIPQCLRDIDSKAYIPQTVSLGPYHHGELRLRSMDRHKWRALNHVLMRTNCRIKVYLDAVKELEEEARACYEEPISLSSNEFVEMMLLDSCFVLELFRGADAGDFTQLGYSENDPIFAMRGAMHSIQRDMIMLENQIPLVILDRLYGVQIGNPNQKGEVAKLALSFFRPLTPTDEALSQSDHDLLESSIGNASYPLTEHGGLHCLEVFRRSLLTIQEDPKQTTRALNKMGSHTKKVADNRRQQLIHCVTELKDAGIKFKPRNTDRFWDIKFENGDLKIPRLLINDGTKSLFLNLIAFEQCHLDCPNDITSYVIFMDNMIDSPGDVSYLHYCGIIENWLGSDAEVAVLFNRLCQEVVFDYNDSSLSILSDEVNRYYNHRWNTWRASLKHRYFNNPWSFISLLAAFVLLVLTLAQTFYTVYAYYAPSS